MFIILPLALVLKIILGVSIGYAFIKSIKYIIRFFGYLYLISPLTTILGFAIMGLPEGIEYHWYYIPLIIIIAWLVGIGLIELSYINELSPLRRLIQNKKEKTLDK